MTTTTDPHGWPDAMRPGYPANPGRDGWHWLKHPEDLRPFPSPWNAELGGWPSGALVAVPREPTDRMIDAAWSAFYHVEPGDGPAWGEVNNAIRRAMLAAAQPRRDEDTPDAPR